MIFIVNIFKFQLNRSLNILDFYLEDDKKVVTDVALINIIEGSKLATKELLKSQGNTIVYHTGSEKLLLK